MIMNWRETVQEVALIFIILIGLNFLTARADAQSQVAIPGPSLELAAVPAVPAAVPGAVPAAIPSAATKPAQPMAVTAPVPIIGPQDENYKLGAGDKLRMIVYGENDLGGEYLVDGAGEVQLPLLGQTPAAGLTVHDFESSVGKKFVSEGYLKDPRVSIEVENYRPFYIMGEVRAPGQYPYVNDMNVLNAVALAGGYTYRADDSKVYVRRNGSSKEEKDPADQTTKINPGDIVRVDERLF
jgi:protein involved in polysaccharide export with SLBB domain